MVYCFYGDPKDMSTWELWFRGQFVFGSCSSIVCSGCYKPSPPCFYWLMYDELWWAIVHGLLCSSPFVITERKMHSKYKPRKYRGDWMFVDSHWTAPSGCLTRIHYYSSPEWCHYRSTVDWFGDVLIGWFLCSFPICRFMLTYVFWHGCKGLQEWQIRQSYLG